MFGGQRRGRSPGMALWLLLYSMLQVGFDRIPPVTLGTIGGQVVIFMKLLDIPWPSLHNVCISVASVWYRKEWSRLLLGSFFHANEWHLYYNMISFMWKGITLERRLGSGYFLYMLAIFSLMTNILLVSLCSVAEHVMEGSGYLTQCAVGFSGVLFALKVVTTDMLPEGTHYVMGFIPVHSRYACWAELVMIQLLIPNTSFMGHLAGICIGLLYVKGPLKSVMDSFIPAVGGVGGGASYTYRAGPTGTRPDRPRTRGQFAGGGQPSGWYPDRQPPYPTGGDPHTPFTSRTGGMTDEEQMAEALRRSRQDMGRQEPSAPPLNEDLNMPTSSPGGAPSGPPGDSTGPSSRLYPDLSGVHNHDHTQEEIRQRRLRRLDPR